MSELRALIDQHAADLDGNFVAIADRLNAPTIVPNPNPQTMTPRRFRLSEVFAAFAQNDIAKIRTIPGWVVDRVESALVSNDREALGNYMAILMDMLSAQTITNLTALMAETEPDPDWTATIAGPSLAAAAGLGWVYPWQVQGALNE